MNARLAGYNILLVEKSKSEAARMSESLTSLGGNVFVANDHVQCLALQHRWDIDLIISEVSFLTGMGDVIAHDVEARAGKSSPLLFVYGQQYSVHPQSVMARGVLKFFSMPLDFNKLTESIAAYLYDPEKHIRQLSEAPKTTQIGFVLKNGVDTWELEVSEFSDEGLVSYIDMGKSASETGSLTVVVPGNGVMRFSVRLEAKSAEAPVLKLKVLLRDRERWQGLLALLDNRQKEINDFLLASSGK